MFQLLTNIIILQKYLKTPMSLIKTNKNSVIPYRIYTVQPTKVSLAMWPLERNCCISQDESSGY